MKDQLDFKGTWECYPRDWTEVKNIRVIIESQFVRVTYSFLNGAVENEFYRYKSASLKDGTINLIGTPYSLVQLNLSDRLIISRYNDGIFKAFDYMFTPVREAKDTPSLSNSPGFGAKAYRDPEQP